MYSLVILLYPLAIALPFALLFFYRSNSTTPSTTANNNNNNPSSDQTNSDPKPKTIMQPAREDLRPPLDDPYTLEELKQFDGSDPSKPIYVSIKGTSVQRRWSSHLYLSHDNNRFFFFHFRNRHHFRRLS